ncbi:hypothetical protein M9Y10_028935 [Tritrichomonas musculus]|uniref:Uncharacterized protein n=1 Tax=Tritrichomonas musculus TaxID=1915356 RepID=A0ABR2KKP9_9EUKA
MDALVEQQNEKQHKFANNLQNDEQKNNITEEEFRDALNKIGAYRTNMSQKRRANWNAYMRKYNARKKAEREQRDKEISLQFNKSYKSYDKEDVNKCLTDCISVLTAVLNRNIERIPQYRIDQINREANNRDMLDYIRALMDTIKKLL